MIYHQSVYYYLASIFLVCLILVRLHTFYKDMFDSEMGWLVSLAIVLHPLSIELFLGPNLVGGALSFWLFLEALFLAKKEKYLLSLCLLFSAGLLNVAYTFVSFYFAWKERKKLKDFRVPILIYCFFSILYMSKNLLHTPHNPFTFFVYYVQTLIFPVFLTLFSYSLFPFSVSALVMVLLMFAILIFKQRSDPRSKSFWPLLFLPVLAVCFHPSNEGDKFWHEIVFQPSSYLCITFAFITILAIQLPRRIFLVYFFCLFWASFVWGRYWFPLSNLLEVAVTDLPEKFEHTINAKRILAWQHIREGHVKLGKTMIVELQELNPKNQDLINDLNVLPK